MSDDVSPAPAPPAAEPSTREERVRYIADEMSRDAWPAWPKSLEHRRGLARRWGCAEATIRDYAAEAHRLVAIDPAEREHLREEIARGMKKIHDDALTTENKVTGLPDYPSAIKALDSFAKYAGIELEQKVKVSGSVALEDLDELRKRLDGGSGDDDSAAGGKPEG